MTGFLKKLTTRSRGNSYVDDDYTGSSPRGELQNPSNPSARPPTSYQSPVRGYSQSPSGIDHRTPSGATLDQKDADNMYAPRPHDGAYHAPPPPPSSSGRAAAAGNGGGGSGLPGSRGSAHMHHDSMRDSGFGDTTPMSPSHHKAGSTGPAVQAPDLLTHAFNEALRPHTDKIEMLEQQLADMQEWVQQQEQQRMEIFSWIDKRGLRPDVPPSISRQMDETADAATSLNQQLDRKITIVNFDLHRLQDDLNDSISSAHFASAMAKFLPEIQRLAALRTGPRFAYELLIKLVGNLNSHGGLEASVNGAAAGDAGLEEEMAEDRRARAAFYARMDEELVDVVRKRGAEGEDWSVPRELKRLEKNAAYLKNLGIDSYFPRAMDVMRRDVGQKEMMGTPPRY